MDDLSGLSWNSNSQSNQKPTAAIPTFNTLRPTPPASGRSTPLSTHASEPVSKPNTPANDSFSNLVSFSSANALSKNLSLQDQQKRIAEAKSQQENARRKQQEAQYGGGGNALFWENLGSGRSTPAPQQERAVSSNGQEGGAKLNKNKNRIETDDMDEDDLLAGFRADAPVDSSTNFPKPSDLSPKLPQEALQRAHVVSEGETRSGQLSETEDDPFGLSELTTSRPGNQRSTPTVTEEEEDVLGLLGKPISNFPKPDLTDAPTKEGKQQGDDDHPQNRAVAELVEMGFPPERCRQALESTENGLDVQAAVGWLLNQAHAQSRRKVRGKEPTLASVHHAGQKGPPRSRPQGESSEPGPVWMRHANGPEDLVERSQNKSPASAERDVSQMGSDFGTTFIKTAGSLWKAGSRKVQKAVQDLNSDSDSGQPKWMKEPSLDTPSTGVRDPPRRRRRSSDTKEPPQQVTDEALMLETDSGRPPRKPARIRESHQISSSANSSRDHSPAVPSRLREEVSPKPAFLRQEPARPKNDTKSSLSRQAIEDDAALAYVSSARRRPKPGPTSTSSSRKPDLLATSQALTAASSHPTTPPQKPSKPSTPIPIRPPAPKRTIPPLDPSSLATSHKHRLDGSSHFKRGDFSSAYISYTSALRPLPRIHPITIILLTNRALTSLKVGEPKQAISDSDAAISLIGPSQGISEFIDLQNGETPKPMRDYYGKALMRKAEALEQMERWKNAAAVWREAVAAGHGGGTAIKGRERCEKAAQPALAPRPASTPAQKTKVVPKRPAVSTVSSDAAVSRLRAANAAAEKADDEKFALADSVEAKLTAWKGGKADNLRALLGILDTVLWPEAGWKKIGMAELVLPSKVKVQYMKGIAKVHPDKISTTATTEQRMIAGAVFATLNEAWDKFKKENGL